MQRNQVRIVTPIDLYVDAMSTDDDVQNVVRLLLSLDADEDFENGIDVSAVPATAADPGFDLEQDAEDFESDSDVLDYVALYGPRVDLVAAETASSHFATTLEESDYFEQENANLGDVTVARRAADLGSGGTPFNDVAQVLLQGDL